MASHNQDHGFFSGVPFSGPDSPSTNEQDYWIYANNETDQNNQTTEDKTGKWLIFRNPGEIDEAWGVIKKATEEGRLGFCSKVSTKKPTMFSGKQQVIGVYTYDWHDYDDVMRIRHVLDTLGFTDRLAYKAEEDSRAGRYTATGQKKFSKYNA